VRGQKTWCRSHPRRADRFLRRQTAKWQIPDDVVFVDAIPLGGTGKMLKTRLREQLADYVLPSL
jgi:fatty-acyl-CoA synthase